MQLKQTRKNEEYHSLTLTTVQCSLNTKTARKTVTSQGFKFLPCLWQPHPGWTGYEIL